MQLYLGVGLTLTYVGVHVAKAAVDRPRVHLAGDYLGTWYTETAAQTAEAAARAVRAQRLG